MKIEFQPYLCGKDMGTIKENVCLSSKMSVTLLHLNT